MGDILIMIGGIGLCVPPLMQICKQPKAPRSAVFLTAILLAVVTVGLAVNLQWQPFASYVVCVTLFTILGLQRRG
jgi:hypothetical protein